MSPPGIGITTVGIVYVLLSVLAGPSACKDGWQSPSIGRQGACSWHGGVDTTPDLIRFGVSGLSGLLAFLVAEVKARKQEQERLQRIYNAPNVESGRIREELHCPLCGHTMVVRLAKRGPRAGRTFMGCSHFPVCRGTRELP